MKKIMATDALDLSIPEKNSTGRRHLGYYSYKS